MYHRNCSRCIVEVGNSLDSPLLAVFARDIFFTLAGHSANHDALLYGRLPTTCVAQVICLRISLPSIYVGIEKQICLVASVDIIHHYSGFLPAEDVS